MKIIIYINILLITSPGITQVMQVERMIQMQQVFRLKQNYVQNKRQITLVSVKNQQS